MSSGSTSESPDDGMAQSQYSLRWNNHQSHVLHAFEALLHAEMLVDVTLVCAETSLKAHKVVLSVCSPFFERIFAEHPCKHPVIVLKDFSGREIAALIDFMYRGEVRIGREDLPALMQAAESLQIRGLIALEPRPVSPSETPTTELLMSVEPSTPEGARQMLIDPTPEEDDSESVTLARDFARDEHHHQHTRLNPFNYTVKDELREACGSPLLMPRRKQARPRRRSGELVMPQDLSRQQPPQCLSPPSVGLNLSNHRDQQQAEPQQARQSTPEAQRRSSPPQLTPPHQPQEEVAENLSMKKEPKRSLSPSTSTDHNMVKSESEAASSPRGSPLTGTNLHPDAPFSDMPATGITAMSSLSLTPPHHPGSEYLASLGQLGQFAAQYFPPSQRHHRDGSPHIKQPPPGFPYQQSESPLAPRSAFPMDGMPPLGGAAGLFPPGGHLDMHDTFKPENFHGLFMGGAANLGGHHHPHPAKKSKKHRGDGLARRWNDHSRGSLPVCRPKGQHSAPRGGPPRSWTNGDLTEALTMVWNKKMTTSQASRVYGIPYNSLLMYVRGKYGKSLKLEQLRRDCTAGEDMNSLNNNVKPPPPPPTGSRMPGLPGMPPGHHPGDSEPPNFSHHSLLSGGLAQGFFSDFQNFPLPVNMVHLMPPTSEAGSGQSNGPADSNGRQDEDHQMDHCGKSSRSPSPEQPMNLHEATPAPALVQQNGASD